MEGAPGCNPEVGYRPCRFDPYLLHQIIISYEDHGLLARDQSPAEIDCPSKLTRMGGAKR